MKYFLKFIFIFIALLFAMNCVSQQSERKLNIAFTNEKITIDGQLNEKLWSSVDSTGDFWQNFPFDSSTAKSRTVVRMAYDKHFIYVSAVCYDEIEGDYVIQSLKRDWSYPVSDAFVVNLDPFCDLNNGFSFGVNPFGVQREGLVQSGGFGGVTTAWDNVWYSETARYKNKWTVEMAIPFKTIRFNPSLVKWKINFARNDLKRNESSAWVKVTRGLNISTMAFAGDLIWDSPPKKTGTNISLIPYAIANGSQDYSTATDIQKIKPNIGLDAKIAVTSSLNLDLTINPDFAQVEVDRQVTNLSRFTIFFPEKRYFFLENSDLFERFGFRQIRPFFSRKIGLNSGKVVPILGGARLSGKLNRNWRIGVMNMQTARDTSINLNGQNYTVAAVQYQLKGRSNIAGIFVNRQGFMNKEISSSDFNRIAGLDFNLASQNGKWNGKAFFHQSISPKYNANAFAHATFLLFNDAKWFLAWNHEYVGNNYNAEVGYVPRVDFYDPIQSVLYKKSYWRFEPEARYKFYPKNSRVNNHGPGLYLSQYLDGGYKTNDMNTYAEYQWSFQNTAKLTVRANQYYTKLYFETDITFSGKTPISAGKYFYKTIYGEFLSDKRQKFNYELRTESGEYFGGYKYYYSVDFSARVQPWGIFSFSMQNNHIIMPNPVGKTFFMLIGPKVELSFTRKLFLAAFFQYNTQANNFNINTRIQWRFRPMSDLYVVYTENYTSQSLSIKNRALSLKLIWWLNL